MTLTKKLSLLLGIPLAGIALSLVTSHFAAPLTTNNDGIGDGKALIVIGAIIYAALGLAASLVLGSIVARFTKSPLGIQLGYAIPNLVAFLIILYGFVSVVLVGNPSPY